MQQVIFSIPETEFKIMVLDAVKSAMSELTPKAQPKEKTPSLLTRAQSAKLLGITLPTLSDYTKKGIVKGYRIGGRIRYYEKDVLSALTEIKTIKYRRA